MSRMINTSESEIFVESLGRALHRYGCPSYRLEEALVLVSRRLGLNAQFFATPTAIFASFGDGRARRNLLLRVDPGDVDLDKLTQLEGVLSRVLRSGLGPRSASKEVDAILKAPPRYGTALHTVAFAVASGMAARFFGGSWPEMLVTTGVGLMVATLGLVLFRSQNAGRLFEPLAATLAAFTATVVAASTGEVSAYVVTLSSLIVLVPGLTLTTAMRELATRNLVSGSARLAGAVLVFLTLGFGVAFGSRVGEAIAGSPGQFVPPSLPEWTVWLALAVSGAALTVVFRAQPRDMFWVMITCAVAFIGSRTGTDLLGPQLGAFLGAVLIGAASSLFSRLRQRPATVTLVPGLILLVPGSLGFRSVSAMLAQDALSGIQAAFAMTLVAIALVTGLLISQVVVPPRGVL